MEASERVEALVKLWVTVTGPLPRLGYFGPISDEIGIVVPDKSQRSFELASDLATEIFCLRHQCKPEKTRIVGIF